MTYKLPVDMRAQLRAIVRNYPDVYDLTAILAEAIDDEAFKYAERTGDYSHAGRMGRFAHAMTQFVEREETP